MYNKYGSINEKRILKKKIVFFITIIIIAIILGFLYYNSNEFKLKHIGYSNSEIKIIEKKLNDKQINKLLNNKYFDNLLK